MIARKFKNKVNGGFFFSSYDPKLPKPYWMFNSNLGRFEEGKGAENEIKGKELESLVSLRRRNNSCYR